MSLDPFAAWAKIRPLLATVPANLKAEIAILDEHLAALQSQAAPVERKLTLESKGLVTEAETLVENFVGKVISKVKGS
jgi:hypothetical protein